MASFKSAQSPLTRPGVSTGPRPALTGLEDANVSVAGLRPQTPFKMNATRSLWLTSAALFLGNVFAQPVVNEPVAVVELGGAAGWDLKDGASSFGADFAVEITPIENWLELEAGTTPVFRSHSAEWSTDLLFKKPWTLSEKAEFMIGVGPEWKISTGVDTSAWAESPTSRIGPISLGMKQAGKPSAGKPPAGFDVAGAGNRPMVRLVDRFSHFVTILRRRSVYFQEKGLALLA